jgi:ABC-type phosphate transport system substrate-binding protein
MAQLRWMWSSYSDEELIATGWNPASLKNNDFDSSTHKWNEFDERCPDEEIELVGEKVNDGTFTSFANFILTDIENGETIALDRIKPYVEVVGFNALKYQLEHNSTVGYAVYTYVFQHNDVFWATPILSTSGKYVTPSIDTIKDRSYPLVRPVFFNVFNDEETLRVAIALIKFGLDKPELLPFTGYVPFDKEHADAMLERLRNGPYREGQLIDTNGCYAPSLGWVFTTLVSVVVYLLI